MPANKPVHRIERDRLISGMEEEREMTLIQGNIGSSGDDQPVVKADLHNLENGLIARISQASTEFSAEITAARAEAKADIGELKGNIGELKGEITAARAEAKADVAELKGNIGELKGEITAARAEAKADIGELKGNIGELKGEITAARAEAKADVAELKSDVTAAIAAMSRRVILGVASMVLVVLVPILVLLFTLDLDPVTVKMESGMQMPASGAPSSTDGIN